nr:pancreatic lipase-like B [Limnephilus flavicornis]
MNKLLIIVTVYMKLLLFVFLCGSVQLARANLLTELNCDPVKYWLGVEFGQLNGTEDEPNLSRMTIDLYTTNKTVKYDLSRAIDVISDPGFDKSLPITIIIHGFLATPYTYITSMASTIYKRGESNVMFIDASSVIYIYYLKASTSVRFIGTEIGTQISKWIAAGVKNKIHLIGHSLGTHISGFTAKVFKQLTGLKIGRISGLDPAGPCFFNSPSELLLSPEDADFVDVMHTDALCFGFVKPLGHVDFYPNGGIDQPLASVIPLSHFRAIQLYAESITNPQNFIGVKCADWNTYLSGNCSSSTNERSVMGFPTNPSTRGIFYLRTGTMLPTFGLGEEGTKPTTFATWWNNVFGGS